MSTAEELWQHKNDHKVAVVLYKGHPATIVQCVPGRKVIIDLPGYGHKTVHASEVTVDTKNSRRW